MKAAFAVPQQMRKNVSDPKNGEIRLLGALEVRLPDGSLAAFPTRKSAALLALLAAEPATSRSRDAIATLLWPHSGEAQGRASLRQTLAQLRKSIGPELAARIGSVGERLNFDADGLAVDTVALAERDAATTAECYRGAFLDGHGPLEDAFDAWARDRRRHFEQLALDSLRDEAEERRARGAADEALAIAERALAIDPTCEVCHRLAIELHLDAGRRSDAAKAWDRCRESLRDLLGVEPSDELQRLYRDRGASTSPVAAVVTPLPTGRTASIAVLPFDNLSDDPEQGYFADGIAEDIITELSRFKSLAVTARHSSFAFRGRERPAREILDELGVAYLLEGSVRRAGGRLRISAQLIDGRDETHVWADRYDVAIESMFEVQDEITRSVASTLAGNIEEARLAATRHDRPEDLGAYDLWLRGMEIVRRGSCESDAEARDHFERALELDPHYARAWVGISLTHFNDWSCQAWDRWDERERGAFDAASRAVQLDDRDHLTHIILGRICAYRRQFGKADRHFDRALALNPNDADGLLQISLGRMLLGQQELALELAAAAFRRNPRVGVWANIYRSYPLFMLGRWEEALADAMRAPDLVVDEPAFIAACHGRLGHAAEAREWADRFRAIFRDKIVAGRDPDPGEPVRWIFHVNPWRLESDREHVRAALADVGLE